MKQKQQKQLTAWRPKGFFQWLLTALSVVLIPLTAMMVYSIFYPTNALSVAGFLGMLALSTPWFLLILTSFIIVLLILASWKKVKIARFILIPLLLLYIFLNVEPIIKMVDYAKKENVQVSLYSHFFNKTELSSKVTKDIVYGKTTDGVELKLDMWPANEKLKNTLTPAVIKVHGGGWVEGSRANTPHWNQWLSELGYTVFDIEYRMPPHAGWKDEVADVKSAIGWVVEHADTYKIDPEKINLMGDSAGGNLAMLAAYSMGDTTLPPSTNVPQVVIRTVINLYGPADMTKFYQNNPSPGYVQNVMKEYIGGTPSQFSDRYQKLSPINYIGEHTPPTITFLGTSDRIVPTEQAKIWDTELSVNNVPHELYLLPRADHVYDGSPGNLNTQFTYEKIKIFLQKYNK
ncbi:alpha/beta hydrolase fold domain-containing protein [Bacillus sp. LK2]|uniref:alpha/beta hydrolase fold domain-containing protein n=1 Tax=Bacillus sp. LK2 TaxID=1628206 RepID=UPI00065380B0|nr:alpha/beta hydrolase fold domain-containing protein [Bacillus sp. LK2]KMN45209.1 lipase [Bacillus sp. LK2]